MATRTSGTPSGWSAVPLRLVTGLVFLVHGLQKAFQFGVGGTAAFLAEQGVPFPGLAAVAVIAVESLGGLALLAGWLTRWAAALLAVVMVVAIATVHLPGGFFVPAGVEFVLTLLGACVSLVLSGPGPLSLDRAGDRG
jgi:putative oxidoreductase